MTERHTFPPKKPGCCVCCGEGIYTVHAYHTDGPHAGEPARIGPMLPTGCQLEVLMSDGTEADIACCVACAKDLAPADYGKVWASVVDRNAVSLQHRPANERRLRMAQTLRVWPVALVRCRREDQAAGRLVVDRRMLA